MVGETSSALRIGGAVLRVIFRWLSVPRCEGAKWLDILANHVSIGFDERIEVTIRRGPKPL